MSPHLNTTSILPSPSSILATGLPLNVFTFSSFDCGQTGLFLFHQKKVEFLAFLRLRRNSRLLPQDLGNVEPGHAQIRVISDVGKRATVAAAIQSSPTEGDLWRNWEFCDTGRGDVKYVPLWSKREGRYPWGSFHSLVSAGGYEQRSVYASHMRHLQRRARRS